MISRTGTKDLKKYLKQMEDRRKGFQKAILKRVAEETLKEIIARAPNDSELGTYTKDLQAAEVSSEEGITAIIYKGPTVVNALDIDASTTLIFIRGLQKETDDNAKLLEVLKEYEPFTVKTFPAINIKHFILTYQSVGIKKVNAVLQTNIDASKRMALSLQSVGIKVNHAKFQDPKMMKLFPDLTFQVLQHELKTKSKPKPHWKPALQNAQKKIFLKKLLNESDNIRILTDPTFNSFKLSGKMNLKVSEQSVQSTADFMEYLLPKETQ